MIPWPETRPKELIRAEIKSFKTLVVKLLKFSIRLSIRRYMRPLRVRATLIM